MRPLRSVGAPVGRTAAMQGTLESGSSVVVPPTEDEIREFEAAREGLPRRPRGTQARGGRDHLGHGSRGGPHGPAHRHRRGPRGDRRGAGMAGEGVRRRLRLARRTGRVRRRRARPRARPRCTASWRPTSTCPTRAARAVAWDMVGPAVPVHGSEDLKQRFLAPDLPRRAAVLAAAQRARGGLRPRRAADPRRARRRRVGRQRPEGVELVRPQGPDRPADGAHRPRRRPSTRA